MTSGLIAMLSVVTVTAVYVSTSLINEAKYQLARARSKRHANQVQVYRSTMLKPEAMK